MRVISMKIHASNLRDALFDRIFPPLNLKYEFGQKRRDVQTCQKETRPACPHPAALTQSLPLSKLVSSPFLWALARMSLTCAVIAFTLVLRGMPYNQISLRSLRGRREYIDI